MLEGGGSGSGSGSGSGNGDGRVCVSVGAFPEALECPCDGGKYDCGKRTPMRTACKCKRLLCRKCAGVLASLPDPAPCGLCGEKAVGPHDMSAFDRDTGVVAALLSTAISAPYVYHIYQIFFFQCCVQFKYLFVFVTCVWQETVLCRMCGHRT